METNPSDPSQARQSENTCVESIDDRKINLAEVTIYLPLITIFIVGLGLIDQLFYYHFFDFDVLTFLDVGEIILDFFTNFIFSILVFLIIVFIAEILRFFTMANKKIRSRIFVGFKKIIDRKLKNIIFLIFFSINTIIFLLLFLLKQKDTPVNLKYFNQILFLIGYISTILVGITIVYWGTYLRNKYPLKLASLYYHSIITVTFMLTATLFIETYNALIITAHSTYGTSIEGTFGKVISNDTTYYIGKTKNYIYFFNQQRKTVEAYQTKDILKLSIEKQNVYKINKFLSLKYQTQLSNKNLADSTKVKFKNSMLKIDSITYFLEH